jgi:hypothetical protein
LLVVARSGTQRLGVSNIRMHYSTKEQSPQMLTAVLLRCARPATALPPLKVAGMIATSVISFPARRALVCVACATRAPPCNTPNHLSRLRFCPGERGQLSRAFAPGLRFSGS